MAGERNEHGVTEAPAIGPEARAFLDKLMEYQLRIKDAVKLAISYYDELSPEDKIRVRSDLNKAGGVLLFGGLLMPAKARETLGIKETSETFHGVSGGGQFGDLMPGGVSLCGNPQADVVLAINLILQLGPQTGLEGMLLLNAVLGAIQVMMNRHLGGQKSALNALAESWRRQYEVLEKAADEALLAKARETGSA